MFDHHHGNGTATATIEGIGAALAQARARYREAAAAADAPGMIAARTEIRRLEGEREAADAEAALAEEMGGRAREIARIQGELPRAEAQFAAAGAPIAELEAAFAAACERRDQLPRYIQETQHNWNAAKFYLDAARAQASTTAGEVRRLSARLATLTEEV